MRETDSIPGDLATAGRRLWSGVLGAYPSLEGSLLEVLHLGAKQADRAAECREILSREGIVILDRYHNPRSHPAVDMERKASAACSQILRGILKAAGPVRVDDSDNSDLFA